VTAASVIRVHRPDDEGTEYLWNDGELPVLHGVTSQKTSWWCVLLLNKEFLLSRIIFIATHLYCAYTISKKCQCQEKTAVNRLSFVRLAVCEKSETRRF
jgi:hypothetical protein